jgi:phospholipase A1
MFYIFILFIFSNVLGQTPDIKEYDSSINEIFLATPNDEFTYYLPTYIIVNDEDLKIQFSGKYRLTKKINLYIAYTQLMFWNIYEESKPFQDIIFNPEIFYRLLERKNSLITSLDFGYAHNSNGKDQAASRSFDRMYIKINTLYKVKSRALQSELKLYKIRNEDKNNQDITSYQGYWELYFFLKNIFAKQHQKLDIEFKIFAGSEIVNFVKGSRQIGLIYHHDSEIFSPSIYLQYYSGYSENLIGYRDRVDNIRLGFMLYL